MVFIKRIAFLGLFCFLMFILCYHFKDYSNSNQTIIYNDYINYCQDCNCYHSICLNGRMFFVWISTFALGQNVVYWFSTLYQSVLYAHSANDQCYCPSDEYPGISAPLPRIKILILAMIHKLFMHILKSVIQANIFPKH